MTDRRSGRLTFEELAELAPGLDFVLGYANHYREDTPPGFCLFEAFYGSFPGEEWGLRAHLRRLVGPRAVGGGVLRTREAYEVAHCKIFETLPPCSPGCTCPVRRGEKGGLARC